MSGNRVSRFDVAGLGKPERTSQGFLRIPAFLTRTGVLEYRRADGTVVRELRPSEEVFKTRSLATLSAAPVTDLHPTEMVTPTNVRDLSIGHVSDDVRPDGELVAAAVTVQHADAIAAVERGDRRELSCGYQCRIDATPGTYKGQSYDQVQRDIVYNHVALGPRNWGRAGRDIALRVDAADGVDGDVFRLDEADALSVATIAPPEDQGDTMELVTLRVDGIDVQVTKQAAQVIEKAIATRDDALADAVTERDSLQGRFDSTQGDLTKAKRQLAEAEDPKRLDAAVNARAELLDAAKRVLSAEYKFDGMTARQVQEAVLLHSDSAIALDKRSDEYVSARFEQLLSDMAAAPTSGRNDGLDQARRVTAPRAPTQRNDARAPAKDWVPAWRRPLSYTAPDYKP